MPNELLNELQEIAGWTDEDMKQISIIGNDPVLHTRFKMGETAAAVHAACGLAAAKLWELRTGHKQHIVVDVSEVVESLNSYLYVRVDEPQKKAEPKKEDKSAKGPTNLSLSKVLSITGSYKTRDDRWFYIHASTGPGPVLEVLNCEGTYEAVKAAVAQRDAQELEDAFDANGANGGICRSAEEWLETKQGKILSALPVVEIKKVGETAPISLPDGKRPLSGIRALDLTRVLAGPTTTRTLAEHGADVLWVGAPHLGDFPTFAIDTGHGKRAAFLDVRNKEDNAKLWGLISKADIFSQSYRLESKMSKEFSWETLTEKFPGIIYTYINAFGTEGPWAARPGWEQVAQAVTGLQLEEARMPVAPVDVATASLPSGPLYMSIHTNVQEGTPHPVPSAFSDYVSGYLNAFGAMVALYRRAIEGGTYLVKSSLAQASMALHRMGRTGYDEAFKCPDCISMDIINKLSLEEYGELGHIMYLGPVVHMTETPPHYELPTVQRGSSKPVWLS